LVNVFAAELAAKRLEFLRELVPSVNRVAVLLNRAEPTIAAANLRDVEAAAAALAVQIRVFNASTIAEIDTAFAALASERPDALFVSSGLFFLIRRVQIAHLATRYAIPAIASPRAYSEAGGLMSYGTNLSDAHHQVGIYVGRILKGAKPVGQVRTHHQRLHCQDARPQRAAISTSHRRRSDRISMPFAAPAYDRLWHEREMPAHAAKVR